MPRKKRSDNPTMSLADLLQEDAASEGPEVDISPEPPTEVVHASEVDPGPIGVPDDHVIPADVLDRLRRGISNGLKPEAFERARDNRIFAYYYVPGRPLMGRGDVELTREQATALGIDFPKACHCVRVVF